MLEQKIYRAVILSIICCLFSAFSYSQLNFDFQKDKFLIKGRVIDRQSGSAIPFANIRFNNTNKGFSCDNEGRFSFYVYKKDTLGFSCAGYMTKTVFVEHIDSTEYYTLEVQLMQDFIKLKEITIYPFKTKEEFADAFIDAKNVNKVLIPGIAPPKYTHITPRAKFTNPISFIYERARKRSSANPDFKP
jgi:hypothetical protein